MQQVKLYLDNDKGLFGINDLDEFPLVMPVFSTEMNARKYIKEMGWTLFNDDLRDRFNELMLDIHFKSNDFMAETGLSPTHIILSEFNYNTVLLFNAVMIGVENNREYEMLCGMRLMVDKGNWKKSRILVGILR